MTKFFMSLAIATIAVGAIAPLASHADGVQARKGTEIDTLLATDLNSKTSHNGDTFQLTEKEGFFHHAPPALKGATIDGHLENVTSAGPTHKATMTMIFDDIKLADGTQEPLQVRLESLSAVEPGTHHIRDAGLIVGGFMVGHMAGNRMGKQHGGLAGAAAGFALASGLKSDIKVRPGTLIKLKFTQDLAGG